MSRKGAKQMVVMLGLAAALGGPAFGADGPRARGRGGERPASLWSWARGWIAAAVCDFGPEIDPDGCPNQAESEPQDFGPIIDPDGARSAREADRPGAARPERRAARP